jgi:predicted GTPase
MSSETKCIACCGTGLNSKGGKCAACDGTMLSEELRLKPSLQPYLIAIADIEAEKQKAKKAKEQIKKLHDSLSMEQINVLIKQCQIQIEKLHDRNYKIIKPLLEIKAFIDQTFKPLIDLWKECLQQLINISNNKK